MVLLRTYTLFLALLLAGSVHALAIPEARAVGVGESLRFVEWSWPERFLPLENVNDLINKKSFVDDGVDHGTAEKRGAIDSDNELEARRTCPAGCKCTGNVAS
jgi:hypothetical protein